MRKESCSPENPVPAVFPSNVGTGFLTQGTGLRAEKPVFSGLSELNESFAKRFTMDSEKVQWGNV